jgi:hypothetical protein
MEQAVVAPGIHHDAISIFCIGISYLYNAKTTHLD